MTSPTSRAITILNEIRALTANTHSGWALPQTLSALQQAHTLTCHALTALEGEQEELDTTPGGTDE